MHQRNVAIILDQKIQSYPEFAKFIDGIVNKEQIVIDDSGQDGVWISRFKQEGQLTLDIVEF